VAGHRHIGATNRRAAGVSSEYGASTTTADRKTHGAVAVTPPRHRRVVPGVRSAAPFAV